MANTTAWMSTNQISLTKNFTNGEWMCQVVKRVKLFYSPTEIPWAELSNLHQDFSPTPAIELSPFLDLWLVAKKAPKYF